MIFIYEAFCASLTTLASGEYAKYLASSGICAAGFIENRYGAFEVAEAGLLDVPGFVGKTRDLLFSKGRFIESKFEYADLRLEENGVRWGSHRAKAIIFCEGYRLNHNPFFNSFALNSCKRRSTHAEGQRFYGRTHHTTRKVVVAHHGRRGQDRNDLYMERIE